jgi:hypothetical protein
MGQFLSGGIIARILAALSGRPTTRPRERAGSAGGPGVKRPRVEIDELSFTSPTPEAERALAELANDFFLLDIGSRFR